MDSNQIERLNKLRKDAVIKLYVLYIMESVLVLGLMILLGRIENGASLISWLMIFSVILYVFSYYYLNPILIKSYRDTYKRTVIPTLMKEYTDSTQYHPEQGIKEKEVAVLELFDIQRYKTEDLIKGSIQGINFECADLHITGLGKNNIQFYGQWYVFDFNKQVEGITHIIEKNDFDLMTGNSGFRKPLGCHTMEVKRYKVENEEFNKWFKIYTNNEHHAMYVLTPHFVEKIMSLESKHVGRLFITFYKNKVHIGLHNGDNYLEPPVTEELTESYFKQHQEDIKTITSIIEELKLNIKLYFD